MTRGTLLAVLPVVAVGAVVGFLLVGSGDDGALDDDAVTREGPDWTPPELRGVGADGRPLRDPRGTGG